MADDKPIELIGYGGIAVAGGASAGKGQPRGLPQRASTASSALPIPEVARPKQPRAPRAKQPRRKQPRASQPKTSAGAPQDLAAQASQPKRLARIPIIKVPAAMAKKAPLPKLPEVHLPPPPAAIPKGPSGPPQTPLQGSLGGGIGGASKKASTPASREKAEDIPSLIPAVEESFVVASEKAPNFSAPSTEEEETTTTSSSWSASTNGGGGGGGTSIVADTEEIPEVTFTEEGEFLPAATETETPAREAGLMGLIKRNKVLVGAVVLLGTAAVLTKKQAEEWTP